MLVDDEVSPISAKKIETSASHLGLSGRHRDAVAAVQLKCCGIAHDTRPQLASHGVPKVRRAVYSAKPIGFSQIEV